MNHLLKHGHIERFVPEEGTGGLSGEVHLLTHAGKKYILRRCGDIATAKKYEGYSKKFEKYGFLPKFLGRHKNDVMYEFIEGRHLRQNEQGKGFEQLGRMEGIISQTKTEGDVDARFKKQLEELVTGEFKFTKKEANKRRKTGVKKIPKPILSRDEAERIERIYDYLKGKAKPTMSLDANDFHEANFILDSSNRVYFVDVEAIRPRIKGFGIAKFYLQWGKTPARRKAFNKGYSSVASMKFLTPEYLDFISLNFLVQKINYTFKIHNRTDYQ